VSEAALKFVEQCTHPKVKGGTRALLKAIAEQIPEGQTTTAPIVIDDLVTEGRSERTVRRNRDALEKHGVIRVLDGGRGNIARYEIVNLDGARPMTSAPLPLMGAAPRRTKRIRKTSDILPDLFDQTSDILTDVRAYTIGHFVRRLILVCSNVGHFARRWWERTKGMRKTSDILTDVQRARTKETRKTSDILTDVGPPLSSSYVRTEALVVVADARARGPADPADAFLEWFEQTYPTCHHGAVCTVDRSRDGPLVRELLQRPRTDVAHLQAMTRCLWAVTTDGVVKSHRWWIAERVTVRNEFILHRKADFLDEVVRRETAADNVWTQVLDHLASTVKRHDFHTWFDGTVLAADHGTGIEIGVLNPMAADWIPKHHGAAVRAALDQVRPGTEIVFVVYTAQQRQNGGR